MIPFRWQSIHDRVANFRGPGRERLRSVRRYRCQLLPEGGEAMSLNKAHNVEGRGGLQVRFEFKGYCGWVETNQTASEWNLDFITVTWGRTVTDDSQACFIYGHKQFICAYLTSFAFYLVLDTKGLSWSLCAHPSEWSTWASAVVCSRWNTRVLFRCSPRSDQQHTI